MQINFDPYDVLQHHHVQIEHINEVLQNLIQAHNQNAQHLQRLHQQIERIERLLKKNADNN